MMTRAPVGMIEERSQVDSNIDYDERAKMISPQNKINDQRNQRSLQS